MRLGVLLGFLIGAAIASLLASSETKESGADGHRGSPLAKLKQRTEEARAAGREAADEKQAEVLQEWERSLHGDATP